MDQLLSFRCLSEYRGEGLEALCDVKTDVGNGIVGEVERSVENGVSNDGGVERGCHRLFLVSILSRLFFKETHGDGKDSGHPVQVVLMVAHLQNLWYNGSLCPLDAEDIRQLFQINRSRFSDRKHGIAQPRHAERPELVIKEFDTELLSEKRDVLDDSLTDPPLLVLGKSHDGGEERLRETIDTNNFINHVKLADQIQSDIAEFILEELQEQWE